MHGEDFSSTIVANKLGKKKPFEIESGLHYINIIDGDRLPTVPSDFFKHFR